MIVQNKAVVKPGLITLIAAFVIVSTGFLIPSLSQTTSGEFQAGTESFKLTYNLMATDSTGTGIAYTPQCFECHLPVNFSYSGTSAPDTKTLAPTDFSHTFAKLNQNDDIDVVKINLLVNRSFTQNAWVPNIICKTITGNITSYEKCTDNGASVSIPSWKWTWELLPSSIVLEKNKWYVIDFVGKRTPSTEAFATDIIPSINSVSLSELAWWNASYLLRTNFTVQLNTPIVTIGNNANRMFMPIVWNTTGLVDAGKMRPDCKDYEVINKSNHIINYIWEGYSNSTYGCNAGNTTVWLYTRYADNSTIESIYYNNSADTTFSNSTRPDDVLIEVHFTDSNSSDYYDSAQYFGSFKKNVGAKQEGDGAFGKAGRFDGSTRYIDYPDRTQYMDNLGSNGVTVFTVFRVDNIVGTVDYLALRPTSFDIFFDTGKIICEPQPTATYVSIPISAGTGEWFIYVCRFTSGSSVDTMLANMTSFIQRKNATTSVTQLNENDRWNIGGFDGSPGDNFVGLFDTFIVVNRSMSDDEINATISALQSRNNSLIAQQAEENVNIADEAEGRTAIELGIRHSLGQNALIYSDQQVYARYLNTSQKLATFDKFTQNDAKRWDINYVTAGENFTSMQNITPSLYVLEISDMTNVDIRIRVSTFINETK